MIKGVQKFFWYGFVILFSWQTVWIVWEVFVGGEKWQYATVGIYLSDGALLACAVFFVAFLRREVWNEMRRDVALWIFAVLCTWTFLSALWAIDMSLAFLSASHVFLLTLTYTLVRYGGFPVRTTLFVFLVSMTLQATVAIGQWVGQYVPPSTLLGIAEHDPSLWGTVVLKTESGRFLRAYGGFEHPNVLGGALAIATIFGVWLSATAKRFGSRVALLAMTILMSFALVFTFSRSGWIAFLVGIIIVLFFGSIGHLNDFLLLSFSRRRESRCHKTNVFSKRIFFEGLSRSWIFGRGISAQSFFKNIFSWWSLDSLRQLADRGNDGNGVGRGAVAVFFAIISFLVCFFLIRDIASSRFSDETLAREGSLSDRAAYMQQALGMIWEQPIFGVGSGNFTAFTQAYFPKEGRFVGDFQPVHMVPILVFAELGAVGFTLFAPLFIVGFVRAWKGRNIFAGSILCALLFPLFLDHWLWSGHFGVMFLGFVLGVIELSFSTSSKRE